MPHPLVDQLRFTRREWLRALDGVPVLDRLGPAELQRWLPNTRQPRTRLVGSTVQRVIYHYWMHIGEITAIRQILGHPDVPEFVGDIDGIAPYRPESTEAPLLAGEHG
jgi:hypothetical protein